MRHRQHVSKTRAPIMRLLIAAIIAFAVAGTIAPMLRDVYAKLAAVVALAP
jgi:hypothetical protein